MAKSRPLVAAVRRWHEWREPPAAFPDLTDAYIGERDPGRAEDRARAALIGEDPDPAVREHPAGLLADALAILGGARPARRSSPGKGGQLVGGRALLAVQRAEALRALAAIVDQHRSQRAADGVKLGHPSDRREKLEELENALRRARGLWRQLPLPERVNVLAELRGGKGRDVEAELGELIVAVEAAVGALPQKAGGADPSTANAALALRCWRLLRRASPRARPADLRRLVQTVHELSTGATAPGLREAVEFAVGYEPPIARDKIRS